MKASVIIPAHNAGQTLPACLAALARQTISRQDFEIIVVDDGSTDDTAALARAAGALTLQQPHRGAAAARNLGARCAGANILLFTDADCEPAEDWVAAMLKPFVDSVVVGVKGTYRSRQRQLMARFVQLEYEDKYQRMARLPAIDFIDTYSAGYRRETFLAYGGFDESYPRANVEDQEFSFRLAADGHRMVFQPEAVVGHRHADTLAAYVRKKFWIGYWKVKVHLRHPRKALSDSHTPAVLRLQIGLLAAGLGLGALGSVCAGAWLAAAGALLALVLSMAPFIVWAWKRDRLVALTAPLFLLARAGALGAGLAAGIAAQAAGRLSRGEKHAPGFRENE